jgi:hypothetical protein
LIRIDEYKLINVNMRKDKKEAIWVTPNVHKKLKVLAAISDEPIGDIASKVIDEYIKKNKELIDSFLDD